MAGTPRGPITTTQYDALKASFREHRGNIARVAAETGLGVWICRKAWTEGWPAVGLPPIVNSLFEEQDEARRIVQARTALTKASSEPSSSALARAAEDQAALEQRVAEGKMAQLAQRNATALMAIISTTIKASVGLAERIAKAMTSGKDERGNQIPVAEQLDMFRRLVSLHKLAIESAHRAQEIERTRLGLPTSIVGIQADMDARTAFERIDYAMSMARRAKELGLIPDDPPHPDAIEVTTTDAPKKE
jgi:hypothetical protein